MKLVMWLGYLILGILVVVAGNTVFFALGEKFMKNHEEN